MDCNVTCLGKEGTTFNMVVFDDPYLFKGGSVRTVHELVGRVLEKVRDDFGKKLFNVDYLEVHEHPGYEADDNIVLELAKEDTSTAIEIEVIPSIVIEGTKNS